MEEFFACVRRGDFRIPICNSCNKKLWPPCKYCSSCFSKADLKRITKDGTLIEFTKSYLGDTEDLFGVVEVCGIRLMGRLSDGSKSLRNGMHVRMTECGLDSAGRVYYNFEPRVSKNEQLRNKKT